MKHQDAPGRIRPAIVIGLAALVTGVTIPFWIQSFKPLRVEEGAEADAPAEPQAPDTAVASEAPVETKTMDPSASQPSPYARPFTIDAGPKSEYQIRVGQVAEHAYTNLIRAEGDGGMPIDPVAEARERAAARNPQAGVRSYYQSEMVRRALSEELRVMRRAAIVEANRAATNQ